MANHPGKDVIVKWLSGEHVQYSDDGKSWCNYPDWNFIANNSTYAHSEGVAIGNNRFQWRIKPTTRRYRVAAFVNEHGHVWTNTVNAEWNAADTEKYSRFSKWLTDWVEYEV